MPSKPETTVTTQTSPIATGMSALSGAAIGPVIIWFCSAVHLEAPPEAVASTMGALLVMGVHWFVNQFLPSKPVDVVATVQAPVTTAQPVTGGATSGQ